MLRFLFVTILLCFCNLVFAQPIDSAKISIGTSLHFRSTILNEVRTINIYLPPGYNPGNATKYPVIYIPDGGMEEDFFHITGIVQFNNQPWIARFPASIIVGIENTDRKRDFTFAVTNLDFLEKAGFKKEQIPKYGGSGHYIDFISKELQPFINKNYNTSGSNTIIGESLAGLLATEILLKYPVLFDTYIIVSPGLWWGGQSLLQQAPLLLNTNLRKPVSVYIGAPNQKEDEAMYRDATALYKIIQQNKNITAIFDYLPEEIHSTVIHQAVYNAFKQLYPKTAYSK